MFVLSMGRGEQALCAAAVGLAGVTAGALAFVSAVDVRVLLRAAKDDKDEYLREHFALWWPAGRDYMVPLASLATLAHGGAYAATGDSTWLVGCGAIGVIGPYTGLVMGGDIKALRGKDGEGAGDVKQATRRFCARHHVRTLLALGALGTSLSATLRRAS